MAKKETREEKLQRVWKNRNKDAQAPYGKADSTSISNGGRVRSIDEEYDELDLRPAKKGGFTPDERRRDDSVSRKIGHEINTFKRGQQHQRTKDSTEHANSVPGKIKKVVDYANPSKSKQRPYGGNLWDDIMEAGKDLILRGPAHVGAKIGRQINQQVRNKKK